MKINIKSNKNVNIQNYLLNKYKSSIDNKTYFLNQK